MNLASRAAAKRRPSSYDARALYTELACLRPSLTQFDMEAESGLGRATIQRIKAGRQVSRATYDDFAAYVAKYRPSPWAACPEMDAHRKRYEWFQSTQPRHVFREWLDGLQATLLASRHLAADTGLEGVFTLWLLAWVAQDLASEFNLCPAENHAQAVARYDQALSRLERVLRDRADGLGLLTERLSFARFTAYFNGQDRQTRSRDPRLAEWIEERGIAESLRRLSLAAPHDWSIQRNGLAVSSLLHDGEGCGCYFEALVAADPRFADLDYQPSGGNTPALSRDPDLWFFAERFAAPVQRASVQATHARV